MLRPKRAEPPILAMLEKAFAKYRKKASELVDKVNFDAGPSS